MSAPTTEGRPVTTDRTPEARLLVVDDEPNILELLATSLRFAGFEVATATNGREALTAARSFRPDLVVLDVMMPGHGRLRRRAPDARRGHHRRRCCSSPRATRPRTRSTGLTVGGDDYVTKPFSLEEIIARIRAVLRRTSGTAERRRRGGPG